MSDFFRNEFLYTQFLDSVKNDLSKEFSSLHTKEEGEKYYNELCKVFYDDKKQPQFDRFDMMTDAHDNLVRVLREADEDFRKKYNAEDFAFSKDYQKVMAVFEKTIRKMPDINANDVRFLQYVFDNYKKYKSSEDYMARLVRKRLLTISKELLHDVNKTGIYESKEAERRETALLIFRQFVKKFGDGTIVIDGEKKSIMLKDRAEKGENGEIKLGAGNYYSPSLEKLAKERNFSDASEMAAQLTYEDMDALIVGKQCKFADIARNLANAYFEKQRKTKEFLYFFAIAFEMTFTADGTEPDPDSDINKCLFHDYYADNLVNRPRTKKEEKVIDGYGINWKNFAECIFLYYIAKSEDEHSAKSKLYHSLHLINSCKNSERAKTEKQLKKDYNRCFSADARTAEFRKGLLKFVLSQEEDKFRSFLLDNYECGYNKKDGNVDSIIPTQYANERRTAADILEGIEKSVGGKEIPSEIIAFSFELSDQPGFGIKYSLDENVKKRAADTVYITREFLGIINNFVQRFLMVGDAGDTARSNHYEETVVFRTDLLSAFADKILIDFYYALKDENADREQLAGIIESFPAFYDYFCEEAKVVSIDGKEYYGADEILFDSNYQGISSKNIFDILLIYLTYRKFYMAANLL